MGAALAGRGGRQRGESSPSRRPLSALIKSPSPRHVVSVTCSRVSAVCVHIFGYTCAGRPADRRSSRGAPAMHPSL
ncbi:hypothetical protein Zmor_021091 [Zophobas morio]|uniref:Uncharacterized protein n=1 Tax=Zophobas morio TaxID=2755281 RepID=A0AA38MAT9_9CUCU|nr:hypothetical protein Zmor_021091 [Zophobas morio]